MFNINRLWLGPDSDSLNDGFDDLFSAKTSTIPSASKQVKSQLDDIELANNKRFERNDNSDSLFTSSQKVANYLEPVNQGAKSMDIVVIEPKTFEDSMGIVKELKSRSTVIVNLQHLDNDCSQRVIDFVSGAAVAMDASYERVGSGVFIFAPINCSLSSNTTNYSSDIYQELFSK